MCRVRRTIRRTRRMPWSTSMLSKACWGDFDRRLTTSQLRDSDSGAGARVSTFAVLRHQRHVRRNLMRIPKPVVAAVALALVAALAAALVAVGTAARGEQARRTLSPGLWQVYNRSLSKARYVDLTHSI